MTTGFYTIDSIDKLSTSDHIGMPWRLLYRVVFNSALRIQELLQATPGQLTKNINGYYILLLVQKNKKRTNELTPLRKQDYLSLLDYIQAYKRPDNEPIFINRLKKSYTTQWFNTMLKRHCELLNIKYESSHAFRRGRVVHLADNKVPYPEIKTLTRHSNIDILIKHYDKDVKKRASEIVEL